MSFGALPLLCLGLYGCGDEPELVVEIEHPTLVQVSPAVFLGDVPCADAPGAMRRYVASAFDVTVDPDSGEAENFPLPSSPPTPCTASVGFGFVAEGRSYAAEIDGYDRTDLVPLDVGTRTLVDPETGAVVEPRWTSSCGREPGTALVAVSEIERTFDACEPLVDREPPSDVAEVRVGLAGALGELTCGEEPGSVERFEVRVGSGAPESAACGEEVVIEGLDPGRVSELELMAFEAGETAPRWGSLCTVKPVTGIVVTATCGMLADRGAVDIDLPEVLSSLDLACDEGLRELAVAVEGDSPLRVTPPACGQKLRLSDLPPGPVTISVTTVLADGSSGPAASCQADVAPGLSARALCVAAE